MARTEWSFHGYITTDCGAADYVRGYYNGHYNNSFSAFQTVTAVLGAGVDQDCGGIVTPVWSDASLLDLLTNATTAKTIGKTINTGATQHIVGCLLADAAVVLS